MKTIRLALWMILILLIALPVSASAGGRLDGRVVMGGSFTLEEDEVLTGDLVVLGGSVTMRQGSLVEGDVFLLGGNANIEGEVTGDMVLLGGNINLRSTGIIQGDVVAFGGNLNRAQGSVIEGDIINEEGFAFPFDFRFPGFGTVSPPSGVRVAFAPLFSALLFMFRNLMMAALAVLVVMFWPAPTDRTAHAVVQQPFLAGGLGLLTFIVAPIVLIMLAITILLSPVSLLAAMILVVAAVFGWIALGTEVGNRLAEVFGWKLNPAANAGIGTFVVSVVVGGIGFIPCVGWIAPFVVAALGVGGVLLTRFGSREYQPAVVAAPPAPEKGKK